MDTYARKWGNSLAIRIPQALAREIGLEQDVPVKMTVEEERLIIVPIPPDPYSLEDLLSQITPDNLHGEIDTGPGVGSEIW